MEELEGDEGEPLVCICEKLLMAPRQSTLTQQHAIFRTKCTIKGKVCDLLIDNGCTENIISSLVVHALQLSTTKHPRPYKVSWVRKGIDSAISKMCKVSFSIGKNFICDVIDMDICHVILARS